MATAPLVPAEPRLISVEEYLRSSYRPDCDFVDGVVEERNLGEYEHGRVQLMLGAIFLRHERDWNVRPVTECRLQVSPERFRIPDVMVLAESQQAHRIVREAPLVCIEVLSPEDTWAKMRGRLNDYLAMGVENVWCFDPEAREARRYTADGFAVVKQPALTVPGTKITIDLAEVFAALDR